MGYVRYINNEKKTIREDFWNGTSELDLSKKNIRELLEISGFDNLKTLDLSINSLTKIKNIECLSELEILDLSDNKIKEIEGISTLIKLELLYLNDNKIREIKGLENLKELCLVHLYDNLIEDVKGFDGLSKMCEISLKNNNIKKISSNQFRGLDRLQHLDLTGNQIEDISDLVGLTNLRELCIRTNNIKSIPVCVIMKMQKLRLLYYDTETLILPQIVERFLLRNMIKSRKSIKSKSTVRDNNCEQRCRKVHDMTLNQMFRDIAENDELTNQLVTYFENQLTKPDIEIDEPICENIYNLIDQPITITYEMMFQEIAMEKVITDETKKILAEYCKMEDVHTQLNILFKEILLSVWNAMATQKKTVQTQMKRNLNDLMQNELCESFSGRVIQLFASLDEADTKPIKETKAIKN